MKLNDVKHIAVIGSGTMGHGIAELAALAGYTVTMQDISEDEEGTHTWKYTYLVCVYWSFMVFTTGSCLFFFF